MGKLSYFLDLEVSYVVDGIFLSKSKYALDILKRASMHESKIISTPLLSNTHLRVNGIPFPDASLYQSIVGVLQYITILDSSSHMLLTMLVKSYKHQLQHTFLRLSGSFII